MCLLCATLVAGTACGARGQPSGKPEQKTSPEKPAAIQAKDDNELQVKSFRLRHADPEEVRQILTQVWTTAAGAKPPVGGRPALPVVAKGPRLAVDSRSHSLFVRGTDKEVKVVASLVAILDTEPGQPAPESKDLRVLRLQHAKVDQATQVLSALGLNAHTVALKKTNAIVIISPSDAHAAEIREVIEKLDVEAQRDTVPLPSKSAKKPTSAPGN
jgi:type II secretory pathway component GspD/PulD (secretin)